MAFLIQVKKTCMLHFTRSRKNEYIAGKEEKRTESIKAEKNSRLDSCADTLCHCRVLWRLSDLSYWSVKQRELEYEKLRQEETLSAATETVIAEPETEESTEETVIYCDPVYDFGQLHEQNQDIYAWIVVPGTQVDYPLLQSETDNYYLDYNLDHSKGYPGCIYTNQCNRKDFSDYNTVLYGHNMKNGSMFGSIHSFEDETFFDGHPYIYVYTENERLTYEIYEAAKLQMCTLRQSM